MATPLDTEATIQADLAILANSSATLDAKFAAVIEILRLRNLI